MDILKPLLMVSNRTDLQLVQQVTVANGATSLVCRLNVAASSSQHHYGKSKSSTSGNSLEILTILWGLDATAGTQVSLKC